MKTDAAVLLEPRKPLRILTVTLPKLDSGQVLIDVAYTGVCRTQILEIKGQKGIDPYLPHTLGHEGSGIVLEIGSNVTKVKPGDHVVMSWIKGVGNEVSSTRYESQEGPINSGPISTFLGQAIVSESRVTKIQNNMPLLEAALLGCAIPTGAGIIFNMLNLGATSSIAIFGVGGVGLSSVLAASHKGAGIIIAVDVLDSKLHWAKRLGATDTVNLRKENVDDAIRNITGPIGVDYAIEATGKREVMEAAFSAIRVKGGRCILAGNLPLGQRIQIDPFDLVNGKRIDGTWGGGTDPDKDIPMYAKLFLSGKLPLDKLISRVYRLTEINKAFCDLEDGRVLRAILDVR